MDEKNLVVIDDQGNEKTMEILFTFDDEDTYKKSYVLYVDPESETGEVFVSRYTEEGVLENIEDEAEWEMIEEVFNAFIVHHSEDDHVHGPDCDHDNHAH